MARYDDILELEPDLNGAGLRVGIIMSRFNVDVSSFGAAVANTRMGALVESVGTSPAAIVVERAMYTNAGGRVWAAGTNALATRLR